VAEAFGQLEEDRRQLGEFQSLAKAVDRFDQRYRAYAGTQSRRQARVLRQAQTEFDNASRARNEALLRFDQAKAEEDGARAACQEQESAFGRARARLDALRADPIMQDANALDRAERDLAARQHALEIASAAVDEANRRLQRSLDDIERAERRAKEAERKLKELRAETMRHAAAAGIAISHGENSLVALDAAALISLAQRDFDRAEADLHNLIARRRDQIALLQQRRSEVERAEQTHSHEHRIRADRQAEAETATERRGQADAEVERQGQFLTDSWERHLGGLEQLIIGPEETIAALTALAEWVVAIRGENPARQILHAAQQRAVERLAERSTALDARRLACEAEISEIESERSRLEAGVDPGPLVPYTRAPDIRAGREGAPLWWLVDFHEGLSDAQQAGLESALEASGLLDAWVSPDGSLQTGDGRSWLYDTQALKRPALPLSLADWLDPAIPHESPVPAATVAQILSGIACASDDVTEAEAWISPDGRFRLGALTGAWMKARPVHIGRTARAAARIRRLAEIAERLRQLGDENATVRAMAEQITCDRRQADEEWRSAPADDVLRSAHVKAAYAARDAQSAFAKLSEAEERLCAAEQGLKAARDRFAADAADMRLPEGAEALLAVQSALDRYRDTLAQLMPAGHELRLAFPELVRCRMRENEAREDLTNSKERVAAARTECDETSARFEALRNAVGAKVDDLKRQLGASIDAEKACEAALARARSALSSAGEQRAVAKEKARSAAELLQQRSEARALAVVRWQQFVAAGLLAAAAPDIEIADTGMPWTIDPALSLARRTEQALSDLKDDEESWSRVQKQMNEEFAELGRALTALGHQTVAEMGDWGLVVHIVYQNRPESPYRLAVRLADEIAQRSELLSARERDVLEKHLQEEIAAEIQRLLQNAERQCDAINKELHKRPTSTGVRFRLIWQTLTEEEGAPVGLEAARKRLLNTSADLWSAEDRSVVGAMLQQCILAERERADSLLGGSGSLLDQLATALDYRRWHRFRVERWQDGRWRKLSGPASSGERALGLTVPLFAAVASFYSQASYPLAPRLMLLDEAFAGIDDAARAHCMSLIREFDLDFVITSEREWACYAELPGVAICQLQRSEGIDAVFVSRWTWDGRARRREADPDRRFALQ
jgi:uncharacterized protein (TIGR02680 family)